MKNKILYRKNDSICKTSLKRTLKVVFGLWGLLSPAKQNISDSLLFVVLSTKNLALPPPSFWQLVGLEEDLTELPLQVWSVAQDAQFESGKGALGRGHKDGSAWVRW